MTSPSKLAAERFCELLKDASDTSGLHLARQLGVPRSTIWRWKQRLDSVDTIGMLADYFKITPSDFLKGERHEQHKQPEKANS